MKRVGEESALSEKRLKSSDGDLAPHHDDGDGDTAPRSSALRCDPRAPGAYKSSFVLVLNHSKTHALLVKETRGKVVKYGLPGGKLNRDSDHNSLDTAARELREETNDLFREKVYRRVREGVGVLGTEVFFDKAGAVAYAVQLSTKDDALVDAPSDGTAAWMDTSCTMFNEEWRAANMHFHASVLCAKLCRFVRRGA